MTANHARIIQSPAAITPISPELSSQQPQAVTDEQETSLPPASPDAAASQTFRSDAEMVPLAKYQAVATELARYKAHFGELPPPETITTESLPTSEPPQAIEAIDTSTGNPAEAYLPSVVSPPEASVNLEQSREETEQLLNILSVNDRDLAHEANDLKEILNISPNSPTTPLKHFGFQRSKSANQ